MALWFARRTSKAGQQAVKVCESCPVRAECLAEALAMEKTTGMRLGIWGGYGPAERAQL